VPAFLFVILLEHLANYKLSTFTRQDDVTQYRDLLITQFTKLTIQNHYCELT
jgi:hypothetical protein